MTMEQTEHDLKSQARRLSRGRHGSGYPWQMSGWTPRLSADGTSASDPYCRKPSPRLSHSVPHSHEQRRLDYGMTAEPVTSCYSSLNTHRQKNRALTSVAPKFSSYVPTSDQTHRSSRHAERMTRNKLLTTNNVAVVRKPCYKDEPEEYEEDDVNYPDENADEEAPGEADEDQDEAYEFNDKDYEEQEADDEIDDESDAFQAQLQRMQNKTHLKPTSHRSQGLRHAENCTSTDLRKLRHQQQIHKMFQDQKIPRHYPQPLETQQTIAHDVSYGDAADVLSDEERLPHSRRSSRGMSDSNQAMNSWFPPRKSLERNRERLVPPAVTGQHEQRQHVHPQQHLQHEHRQQQRFAQQSRKYRSTKPELESLMMPAPARSNPQSKKCCICEGSTEPVMMKVGTPGKGNCRLQECRGFTVKGPTGEDGEAEEQVVCARCARRHNMEDFQSGCEAPVPEGNANSYGSKSHRSRQHHRSPTYECNAEDNNQSLDDVYSSRQLQPNDTVDYRTLVPRERTRHSVQSARSPFRGTRYG
ncbi:uncharacterized protein LOC125502285 [Athalia rosae]|uniref:uncharacterized protein LOC125502285 n=1 Tax=Athalia rosae TaxID=37344 RepID=UPI0020349E95|nr:uncharacterized protein LOC125502285 [Athalia rosae]